MTVEIGDTLRRAAAREPRVERIYAACSARVPRAARRDLREGRTVRARVTAIAADNAANTTTRSPPCNTEALMPKDTGLPRADAQYDFSRARRRRALARLSARLRREPTTST